MSESNVGLVETGAGYGITRRKLAAPVAGAEGQSVFDWQNKGELEFAEWGGIAGVCERVKTNTKCGLTVDEAEFEARRQHFGSNARPPQHKVTYCELIWEGLHDFTLIVLICAAVVSLVIGFTV